MTPSPAGAPVLRELVVCSLEAWDEVWRRNQLLMKELLELEPHLRVLFVEPAVDAFLEVVVRKRLRRGSGRADVRGHGIPRLVTFEPTKRLPRLVDPIADAALAAKVERAARAVGFSSPLLWVNDPSSAVLSERTRWPTLYDVTDDWLKLRGSARELERRHRDEAYLLARAREVVVCSPALAESKGRYRKVRLVSNAVEPGWIRAPAERPRDLPAGPVACYVGSLHEDRLDVELCIEVARRLRGRGTLVLVGPDALGADARRRLADQPAIVLTGARPYTSVPAYLQHADVLVVPHLVTPFTESLDPIKGYEYRAVGRPIVATPVAGFRELGSPVVVAQARAFVDAVLGEIPGSPKPPELLPLPPGLPTWRSRAEAMRDVLRSMMKATNNASAK